jgi:hypothetical protein
MTTDELRITVASNRADELDPLRAFSAACRIELSGAEPTSGGIKSRRAS